MNDLFSIEGKVAVVTGGSRGIGLMIARGYVEAGARVLGHRGRVFTPDSIGDALATRDLMADLREGGEMTGGPPPFSKRDRSKYLQALDQTVNSVLRELG